MRIAVSEFKCPFYCRHVYTHLRCQWGAERRGILFLEINPFYSFLKENWLESILKWFIYCYYCLTSKIDRRICRNFRGWKFIFQSSSVWKCVTKRKIQQNFRWKKKNATLFFHWSYTHITQQESSYSTFAPREPLFRARIAFWRI